MIRVAILLIALVNCAAFFFGSYVAAGATGGADGIRKAWLYGSVWIAAWTMAALFVGARRNEAAGVVLAVATLPAAYLLMFAATSLKEGFDAAKPRSPEFELACQSAGARFVAPPSSPIGSIAFDWKPGTYPPQINFFSSDAHGNVESVSGGVLRFPGEIKFTEGRCCQYEGGPTNKVGPFIRRPNGGDYFGVTELTADALVEYTSAAAQLPNDNLMRKYELVVKDRRDGRTLATMRYFLDARMRRGCSTAGSGVMDEQAFVLDAVKTVR